MMQQQQMQQPGMGQPMMQQPVYVQQTQNTGVVGDIQNAFNPRPVMYQQPMVVTTQAMVHHKPTGPIHRNTVHSFEIECYKCQHRGMTDVHLFNGSTVWLAVLICFITGFFLLIPWCLCCIPCCINDMKDANHQCSHCHTVVAYKGKMH